MIITAPTRACRFQSTHPVRGATSIPGKIKQFFEFQSTHPVRGATSSSEASITRPPDFNPRTP